MALLFSIIIPSFNRPVPLRYTLRSAEEAAARLPRKAVEIIVVDDGSQPAISAQLEGFEVSKFVRVVRKENEGSIQARMVGLKEATGERVLFLDSDDLIHPDKLRLHFETTAATDADITYDDMAIAKLHPGHSATYERGETLAKARTGPELLLQVQPPPHCPIFRREYLTHALSNPMVAADRRMDPAGDIWLYYNLCTFSAKVTKIDSPLTAIGPHAESRFSSHWETLGVAALLVVEAFQRRCSDDAATLIARRLVGEVAFSSWRRLPYDFNPSFSERLLQIWKRAPKGHNSALGGAGFELVARLLGPVAAGKILRRLRGRPYSESRTLDDESLAKLMAASR